MRSYIRIVICASICIGSRAQDLNGHDLAVRLARSELRGEALRLLASNPKKGSALLLSLAEHPPEDVDLQDFTVGLCKGFGVLRTKEAVPFLIKNISLQNDVAANIWMKSAPAILGRMPAVNALVEIGKPAIDGLIRASWGPLDPLDRLAVIFTVVQIDPKGAREYLRAVSREINLQLYWVDLGIRASDEVR